jgi:hypothetical protein
MGGTSYTITEGQLPFFTAIPSGTNVCYSFESTIASTNSRIYYAWSLLDGTGSASAESSESGEFTISSPSSVTATYSEVTSQVFTIDSPVNLLVTDPDGNQAGFEANGTTVNQIQGAIIVGPCSLQSDEEVNVTIPNPLAGNYSVEIFPSCASASGSAYTIDLQDSTGSQVYSGTAYQGESSQTISVPLAFTTTSLACNSPVVVGAPSTCTVKVSGAYGSTNGEKVYFTTPGLGAFNSTTCSLNSGNCSVNYTPATTVGSPQAITATYGGDFNNEGSSDTFSLTVNSVVVVCTPSPVVVGKPTTCTPTITGSKPFTGTITWTTSGSGKFSPTSAVCKLSKTKNSCLVKYTPSSAGTVTITASYSPSGSSKNPSSSGTFSLTVNKTTSKTTLSCSPNSVAVGSSKKIKCTLTVTGYNPTPPIRIMIGGSGGANIAISPCPSWPHWCIALGGTEAGTVTITASYGGDGNNTASSSIVSLTIKPVKAKLSVSCTSPSAGVGSGVTCTATLTGYYGSVSGETISWSQISGKGSVSFPSLATCALSSAGTCSIAVTGVSKGSVTIEAVYSGDTNNLGSSKTMGLKVKPTVLIAPSVEVSPTTIDSGQSAVLSTSASFSGGTSPYTCQWLEEAPGASSYSDLGSSFSCTAGSMPSETTGSLTAVGTWSFELQVKDGSGVPVTVTSSPVSVVVNTALSLTSFTLSPTSTDTGVPVTVTATVYWVGGTSPYTVTLYSGSSVTCSSDTVVVSVSGAHIPNPKTGLINSSVSFTFPSPASDTYYCAQVEDSSTPAVTVLSTTVEFTINVPLGLPTSLALLGSGQPSPYAIATYSSKTTTLKVT